MNKKINLLDKILLIIYNMLFLLVPVCLNFHGISYSKILFIYSICIFLYIIFVKKFKIKLLFKNKIFKFILIGYFSLMLIISLSIVINSIDAEKVIISNFYEILRIILYYLIFVNYYCLLNKDNFKVFNLSLIILIIFNIILSFFQFYNLFGLNELYIKTIAPTQYRTLVNGYKWPRAVGLVGNPNVMGFLMTLFSIYILFLILKDYKKWYYYIIYSFVVICVFLTASRTSYISLIMGNFVLLFLSILKIKKIKFTKIVLICLVFLSFHGLLVLTLPNSYTWRIKEIINYKNATSWQKRVDNNKEFIYELENIDKKNDVDVNEDNKKDFDNIDIEGNVSSKKYTLLIGNGPDKMMEYHKNYFDNEWFMFIFRYGIIGLMAYLFMVCVPLVYFKKDKDFNYCIYISLLVANFIYMIAAGSFHSYVLFGITIIFMVLSLKYNKIRTS